METGVVLTATELEGCAPAADWSRWILNGRASQPDPSRVAFAQSWREDLEQLAGLGITSIQITLEWARLEPEQGRHDDTDIEFRRELLETAKGLGLTTWGCLVDGTLPGWFSEDQGGFADDRSRGIVWPRHVDWIGEHFGDLVDGWVTQREPLTWALRRYLRAEAPPGRQDATLAAGAVRDSMLAEGEAWRLLKGTAPVAAYQTVRPIRSAKALGGGDDIKARPHAQNLERLLWHPWVSAITEGQLVVSDLPTRTVDHLRGAFDRIVVELRSPIEVTSEGEWRSLPLQPDSMAESLRRVAEEFETHEVVGAGNLAPIPDDGRARPDHMQAVLDLTSEATTETSVTGWWQSSPIDGYHWLAGSASHGLIEAGRAESPAATTFRGSAEIPS